MPARYDRTALRALATTHGHARPDHLARALGIGRMTAWRLWNGHGRPAAETAAAVQTAYGLPAAALLIPEQAA